MVLVLDNYYLTTNFMSFEKRKLKLYKVTVGIKNFIQFLLYI